MSEQHGPMSRMEIIEDKSGGKKGKSSMSLATTLALMMGLMIVVLFTFLCLLAQTISLQNKIGQLDEIRKEDTAKLVQDESNKILSHIQDIMQQTKTTLLESHTQDTANIIQREQDIDRTQDILLQVMAQYENRTLETATMIQKELSVALERAQNTTRNFQKELIVGSKRVQDIIQQETTNIVQNELKLGLDRMKQDTAEIVREELNVALNDTRGTTKIVQEELNKGLNHIQNTADSIREELNVASNRTQDTANILQKDVNITLNHAKETADIVYKVLDKVSAGVTWVADRMGHFPPNAIQGGYSNTDNETLYICRVYHEKHLRVGTLHPSHKKCYFSFDVREFNSESYEVLVKI